MARERRADSPLVPSISMPSKSSSSFFGLSNRPCLALSLVTALLVCTSSPVTSISFIGAFWFNATMARLACTL